MVVRKSITCSAPVNIAAIKYWGKRNEDLILPVNSSLSVTLNQDHLFTKTTIIGDSNFTEDRLYLNGQRENVHSKRIQNVLTSMRQRAKSQAFKTGNKLLQELVSCNLHIISENNFPTAAGLASSASGYACLVFTLYKLFDLEDSLESTSAVARMGSGSACRSLFGGYVMWEMGNNLDGSDSYAIPWASEQHWPDMHVLILVVSDHKKDVSSTSGMQNSVKTSKFLTDYRAKTIVPDRLNRIKEAIATKNFENFAQITMQDSNQFHSVCLDTYPPIFYMNDVSRRIVTLVHRYNSLFGESKIAYTFDAGPNAVIFGLKDNIVSFAKLVVDLFPTDNQSMSTYFRSSVDIFFSSLKSEELGDLKKSLSMDPIPNALQYIIHTSVGDGPRVLREEDALIDLALQDL